MLTATAFRDHHRLRCAQCREAHCTEPQPAEVDVLGLGKHRRRPGEGDQSTRERAQMQRLQVLQRGQQKRQERPDGHHDRRDTGRNLLHPHVQQRIADSEREETVETQHRQLAGPGQRYPGYEQHRSEDHRRERESRARAPQRLELAITETVRRRSCRPLGVQRSRARSAAVEPMDPTATAPLTASPPSSSSPTRDAATAQELMTVTPSLRSMACAGPRSLAEHVMIAWRVDSGRCRARWRVVVASKGGRSNLVS
jgi:hypothetical protein